MASAASAAVASAAGSVAAAARVTVTAAVEAAAGAAAGAAPSSLLLLLQPPCYVQSVEYFNDVGMVDEDKWWPKRKKRPTFSSSSSVSFHSFCSFASIRFYGLQLKAFSIVTFHRDLMKTLHQYKHASAIAQFQRVLFISSRLFDVFFPFSLPPPPPLLLLSFFLSPTSASFFSSTFFPLLLVAQFATNCAVNDMPRINTVSS